MEGDLNDPSYKLGKAIWQVFKNLIIKAATATYNLIANAFGDKGIPAESIKINNVKNAEQAAKESMPKYLVNLIFNEVASDKAAKPSDKIN